MPPPHWDSLIFRGLANLFFGLQCIAGLVFVWLPWATILKTLQVEECFQRECQGETLSENWNDRGFHLSYTICQELVVFAVRDEVFWTEDLIEETTKGLHDSYTILTLIQNMTCLPDWTVLYPVLSSNLRLVLHMLAFGTKTQRINEGCPLPWSSGRTGAPNG